MKIARLDGLARQDDLFEGGESDPHYENRQRLAVDDAYDFGGNAATDVSSIENWDSWGATICKDSDGCNLSLVEIRDIIDILVTAKTFASCTAGEKIVASKWFVVSKTDRDTVHSDAEQAAFSNYLYCYADILIAVVTPTPTMPVGVGFTREYWPYSCRIEEMISDLITQGTTLSDIDVLVDGVSIFTTRITIDANESTNTTAATAYVIADGKEYINKGQKVEVEVKTAGTDAAGSGITFKVKKIDE